MYFGKDGVYLAVSRPEPGAGNAQVIKLAPVGENPQPEIAGEERNQAVVSYLLGSDRDQWFTSVSTFGAVIYREICPGIDLKFYGVGDRLEYDAIIKPGADPERLRFSYQGSMRCG